MPGKDVVRLKSDDVYLATSKCVCDTQERLRNVKYLHQPPVPRHVKAQLPSKLSHPMSTLSKSYKASYWLLKLFILIGR